MVRARDVKKKKKTKVEEPPDSEECRSEKMVLTEQNNVSSKEVVVAENIISKIHNMHWLKSSADSSEPTMGRNRKSKLNAKSLAAVASTSNGVPGPSGTVWDVNKKTGENLFPNSNAASAENDDHDEELLKALITSRLEFEASEEMKNLYIEKVEDLPNKSDDEHDNYWTTKQSNLPSPEAERAEKPSDTNNNSSGKTETVGPINDCPQGRFVTGRNNGRVGKKVQKIEENCAANVVASSGRGKVPGDKFERGNNRQEFPAGMVRGGPRRDQRLGMNHSKFQAGSNSGNVGDNPEQENNDSRRNKNKAYNNRQLTYHQSSGYSHNAGQDFVMRDKYHFVRNQSQPQREIVESTSRNKNEIKEMSAAGSSEIAAKVGETSDKNVNSEVTPQLRILKNDKKPESEEICGTQQNEKLRLQGFHSRSNRPPPDDEVIVPSKPLETEFAAGAIIPHDFPRSLEPPQNSSTKLDAPPGFHNVQPVPNYNKPPIPNLASNPNSQRIYENLAIHDPLLHRLLQQKQQYDYLSDTNRQDLVTYDNYQAEEEPQQAIQSPPISEQQTCLRPEGVPPNFELLNHPIDPSIKYIILPVPQAAYSNNYHANLQPFVLAANNSLSNMNYAENDPNVQMSSESACRTVTPRGTAPAHRPPAQMMQAQFGISQGTHFQQPYFEDPRENLFVPNYSLANNQFQETPRLYLPTTMQQFANSSSNPTFKPQSRVFNQNIPRPCGPQLNQRLSQPPFSMEQFAGNQHFEYSLGNPEIRPNGASPFNQDPRRIRAQQMSNTERVQERLPPR